MAILVKQPAGDRAAEHRLPGKRSIVHTINIHVVGMRAEGNGARHVQFPESKRDAVAHGFAGRAGSGAQIRKGEVLQALQRAGLGGLVGAHLRVGRVVAKDGGVRVDVDVAIESGHRSAEAVWVLEERRSAETRIDVELATV